MAGGVTGTFALDIARFVEKTKAKPSLVVKKLAFDMHAAVAMRTPVDTGRARANWQVGPALNSAVRLAGWSPGESSVAGSSSGGINLVAYIFNNVHYIRYLEEGTSRQAPHGMVRITVSEFQQFLDKAVASLR